MTVRTTTVTAADRGEQLSLGVSLPVPAASDERRARAAWSRIAEPGDVVARALIQGVGAVAALEAVASRAESSLERFRGRLDALDVDRDLEIGAKLGARVIIPGDSDWPVGVDDLVAPPYCLWVRGPGDLGALCRRSVAVVGARASSAYGNRVASDIATGLAERGVTVVSGAALGIDGWAHRGALAGAGATVAVLAGGVDRTYPIAHRDLLLQIAESGAVVSESAPGSAPTKSRFLQRNRLIATASQGTIVVEAGLRSGSRNTATTASTYHRMVMAVPGPVTSPASAGCHEMIRSGMAALVTDTDEVMELISGSGQHLAPERRAPERPGDDLDPLDRRVFEALTTRGRDLDKLAVVSGLSPAEVRSALGRLALFGYAARDATGGWRSAPRPRTTR